MNRDIEQGFSQIPNGLLEAIARSHFSTNQNRLMWGMVREVYGWKCKRQTGTNLAKIARITALPISTISKAAKELLERKVIRVVESSVNQKTRKYLINLDFGQWGKVEAVVNCCKSSQPEVDRAINPKLTEHSTSEYHSAQAGQGSGRPLNKTLNKRINKGDFLSKNRSGEKNNYYSSQNGSISPILAALKAGKY